MQIEQEAALTKKTILGIGNSILTFSCESIALHAQPGQFVNISCGSFLKRPFGVFAVDPVLKTFSIGVREVGIGTKWLLQARVGDMFSVLGPLGHGFSFEGVSKIITVGGGTGIYPLFFALNRARDLNIPTISINGFRCSEEAFLRKECEVISQKSMFSSDSGDFGIKGNVLDSLNLLSADEINGADVFAVGPEIMMQKVCEWSIIKGLRCQVSLEKRMACGIGICLVCSCKVKAAEDGTPFHHVRCCKEGPVFYSSEVIW